MLTGEDIQKLKEVLATKEDMGKLVTLEEFDRSESEVKQDISDLRESIQALTVSVDKLVKSVGDLKTEYAAVKIQMSRHEKWILQLADKLGIKLEY
ncbi:MAG: hypothetical protein ABH813_00795 [Patescibacteria group bacterium]